MREISIVR